jgi:hypothetical protein
VLSSLRALPRRWGLAILALLAALGPAEALGWCRTTTSPAQPDPLVCPRQGTPVAWPYACAALHLDPRMPPDTFPLEDLRRVVSASIDHWATVPCDVARQSHPGFRLHLLGDLDAPLGYFEGGPNANTVAVSRRWPDDPFHLPDAAALTVVTFSSDTAAVLDTDVELNARSPSNPRGMPFSLRESEPASIDLETTVTHELGHVQGLAHSAERTAVMWAVVRSGEQRWTPSADDAQGICAVYPPGDVSACDTTLRGLTFHGQGVSCGARPRPVGARASWASVGLALLAVLRSRRKERSHIR